MEGGWDQNIFHFSVEAHKQHAAGLCLVLVPLGGWGSSEVGWDTGVRGSSVTLRLG